jgi:hypothetical protein
MRARMIDIVSRISRRPLALGTVLVAVRETQEPRPLHFEHARPASVWAHLLSFFALAAGGSAVPAEIANPGAPQRHAHPVATCERCGDGAQTEPAVAAAEAPTQPA